MEEKARLFTLSYRKLLYLIQEATALDDSMTFFYRAAALADIYRFISLWRLDHGAFSFDQPKKIAFFPGTFDPFTLSHKGIARAIRDMGFEVYLSVDEFSWSKNAQPSRIRRQIVNMSVAGDFHINLFPADIPINIANPRTLRRLLELFPNQKVYVVVGSDVPSNASSYKAPSRPWSIHRMNHIIFRRAGEPELPKNLPITGDVIRLQLPSYLKDISSTRIREGVDSNRDISNLIDPVIQDFIYQNGLYLKGSQNKPMLEVGQLEFKWLGAPDPALLSEVSAALPAWTPSAPPSPGRGTGCSCCAARTTTSPPASSATAPWPPPSCSPPWGIPPWPTGCVCGPPAGCCSSPPWPPTRTTPARTACSCCCPSCWPRRWRSPASTPSSIPMTGSPPPSRRTCSPGRASPPGRGTCPSGRWTCTPPPC